jgi:MFS family permease
VQDTKFLSEKRRNVILLGVAQVFALSVWFSASAVVPDLKADYGLSGWHASLFTSAVSIGFVFGTLISATLTLADRYPPSKLFAVCAFLGAAANGAILLFEPTSMTVIVLRFVTGATLAGVYPVGMKIASSWARGDTGFLVGILVGALTVGSALPHLFNVLGGIDWRFTIAAASVAELIAAGVLLMVKAGPNLAPSAPFDPTQMLQAWRNKPLRLANFGYLGHMWELYAMWGWIGAFLAASFSISGVDAPLIWAGLATFAVIAAGGLGSVFGGVFADRMGRTTLTMGALGISGACCVLVGLIYGGSPWLMIVVCLIWGAAVVADSAQFSTCVIELADKRYVGTMLTFQTSTGFLLTLLTIHLIPEVANLIGWQWAMAPLAIGPVFGVWAMARLRAHPDSIKLANGNR